MDADPIATDTIVDLLDTARALRVLAAGDVEETGQGASPGLAMMLRLLADHVDCCAKRLDNAGIC